MFDLEEYQCQDCAHFQCSIQKHLGAAKCFYTEVWVRMDDPICEEFKLDRVNKPKPKKKSKRLDISGGC